MCVPSLNELQHDYASREERDLEWSYIDALSALKEHTCAPIIDHRVEPNRKKRKAKQRERGFKSAQMLYV